MKKLKKKIAITLILMLIILMTIAIPNYAEKSDNKLSAIQEENAISVEYKSHIQNIGWQEKAINGQTAGTEGKSLRLEALKINLINAPEKIKIKYQTHVQNIGWQNWKEDGELSGTEGKGLRLEAIKIELEDTEEYSIMYRVHVQNIGWQDWKIDGEIAGTEGQKLRLEAIEVKIVEKQKKSWIYLDSATNGTVYYDKENIVVYGWKMSNISNTKIVVYIDEEKEPIDEKLITYTKRPDVINEIKGYGTEQQNPKPGFSFEINTEKMSAGNHRINILLKTDKKETIGTYITTIRIDRDVHISYNSHVQNIGWQNWVEDGETAGTEGCALRVEALKMQLINAPEGAKIKYRAHVQNIGWQDWVENGELAGTEGQALRIEAIQIELENMDEYSIEYRTHIQGIGWQNWANDGEISGTIGQSKRIEAIEIRIVPPIIEERIRMYIDTIVPQGIGKEKIVISGWLMTNIENTKMQAKINGKNIDTEIKRSQRPDVLQAIKGYGGEEKNPTPGFEFTVDFTNSEIENKNIKIQIVNGEGKILAEQEINTKVYPKIEYSSGVYGVTGLKVAGRGGNDLKYLKYGNGENVFFATFAIHGFEDLWDKDGYELVDIANQFYNELVSSNDYELAEKWTIYIFPGVNMDGLTNGTTKDGPGRTTLYSQAPNNQGIDLNRCWQVGNTYTRFTSKRNYNGTTGFQAYEAQALRDFMLANKSRKGQTILVDLHGWTQQVIGDSGICSYYSKQFPENSPSLDRYGTGYMINWARTYLGSNAGAARSALIELPKQGITGHQSVLNYNFANRYINATLEMLKNII